MAIQLVWFKRDLRVVDHAPLVAAAARGPVLPLYIVEPAYWALPDTSARQWAAVADGLRDLREALAGCGQPLVLRSGEAIAVLEALHREHGFDAVWSHEETGNGWTYQRDLRVAAWLKSRGIAWTEAPSGGVERGLKRRLRWAGEWERRLAPSPVPPPTLAPIVVNGLGELPSTTELALVDDFCPGRQRGGRARGERALATFLSGRGAGYMRAMSSPLSAETRCSRFSVALATGALSLREVVHAVRDADRGAGCPVPARDLASLDKRLHWHCHFIQKLESEPEIEFRNVNRGFDGMREDSFDPAAFTAWCRGETGWPFVDACMRSLQATGWINFRMRAMLVSVASYQLWLHWREPALHLARLFTDYEPGIHFPQVQMQAGVTGINIPRIYNPIKQSRDQDPDGHFIRRWLPELAGVPGDWLHEPWKMSAAMQRSAGAVIERDYPAPIRDHELAARQGRAMLSTWRKGPLVREEAARVFDQHGSRARAARNARGRNTPKTVVEPAQGDLF